MHVQFVTYSDSHPLFWRPGVYLSVPSLAIVQLLFSCLNVEVGTCSYSITSYFCNQFVRSILNSFLVLWHASSSASLEFLADPFNVNSTLGIHTIRLGTKLWTPPPRNCICCILLFVTVKHCWCGFAVSFAFSVKSSLRWCQKPYLDQATTDTLLLPCKASYTVTV